MGRKKAHFFDAEFSRQFEKAYSKLERRRQEAVDETVIALLKGSPTPGMRVKPIEPEKYYLEARINSGDRLIHRVDSGVVYFVDVVSHDLIGKYGSRRS